MPSRQPRAPKADPETDEAIHAAIARAVMDGSLRAGTKLAEHRLAEIFGVSRERIRKVLHRLGAERRIEIIPNRGARVPQPTLAEIRAIYEAHRVLEAGVLMALLPRLDDAVLARLDAHLAEERAAAERGDRSASVRLSGAFHLLLVDAVGNAELSRILRDLLSRSSVMVSVYEPASQSICAVDEHGAIVEALRARDVARAVALSAHHFQHVEQRLRVDPGPAPATDLAAAFRPYAPAKTVRARRGR
ncbi:GntR family transcriptional regulator [Rhodoplanes sp. TEM]|uniref:GntR family transcriptional regulator n=1 Tax=Rhodoplanes tepidamans TaxID=200616 RepID=A0ABT5JFX5_RHOTP|nr:MULTISPECIES: GntR family transcriptional regulator [Rhodoplanes]MDC7788241.1 GntR family transcriptional regulator [Rhodoplanes tepidamans]MDC7982954.1 GntR family transcriptional regulator [Rhodoplanes sp. TEM]MDQ0355891.1 DNA-binding GntR family transcriptional regulator [Rhodoplanes tepidamans]